MIPLERKGKVLTRRWLFTWTALSFAGCAVRGVLVLAAAPFVLAGCVCWFVIHTLLLAFMLGLIAFAEACAEPG